MTRSLSLLYAVLCYALFLVVFLYSIGFVGNAFVPRSIDGGEGVEPGPLIGSLITDALLLGLFAVQHSVMARPAFKRMWTRIVPAAIERSTYVLFSSLALAALFYWWQPLPQPVWTLDGIAAQAMLGLFAVGWVIVLSSTFLIDHFDLFGLRQVWAYRRSGETPPPEFRTPLFYRMVRHPLYLGFIIAFWAAPTMSQGHLAFAIATTAYILIAIQLEERDLVGTFGDRYRDYQKRVSMIVPWFARKAA